MRLEEYLQKALRRTGLTESEVKLYLAAFKNKSSTLKQLQKKTKLSTATAYRTLEKLKSKNLISISNKSWRENIQAASLKNLAFKVAREKRHLEKLEAMLRKANSLMDFQNFAHSKAPIEVLFDKDELIDHCYKIVQEDWTQILCYGSPEKLVKILGDQVEKNFVRLRVARGKVGHAIFTEIGNYAKEILPNNKQELRNVKIKIEKENQNEMIYIHGDKVTVWQNEENNGPSALLINESSIVNFYKQAFRKEWVNFSVR